MGLFDFLKKHKGEHKETHNGKTFWVPDQISNEEYQEKRRKEALHWERLYDLSTVQGVSAIPVPRRKTDASGNGSVTGQIEYYLMHKAGQYETEGKVELALACYRKTNELMPMAYFSYQRNYYMRLPRYLRKLRRFDEARAEEATIEKMFSSGSALSDADEARYQGSKSAEIRWAEKEGTDLVEVSWISGCCEICGKYRGRIFSMHGKDSRFPKFPADFCKKCGLTYSSFFDFSTPQYSKKHGRALIREMNKPFIDTRTQQDMENYEEVLMQIKTDAIRKKNSEDYDWLWEFLPELCPKSLSGYSRMKNSNSKNYQKIVAEAAKRGFNL